MPGGVIVAVTGPRDWRPPEEMRLEIGDDAWAITGDGGGGVVSAISGSPVQVRLVGVPSCQRYAFFEARPGSASVIRFAADGSLMVEDWTGQPIDSGPLLSEAKASGCP
jgi:hypothetical protein